MRSTALTAAAVLLLAERIRAQSVIICGHDSPDCRPVTGGELLGAIGPFILPFALGILGMFFYACYSLIKGHSSVVSSTAATPPTDVALELPGTSTTLGNPMNGATSTTTGSSTSTSTTSTSPPTSTVGSVSLTVPGRSAPMHPHPLSYQNRTSGWKCDVCATSFPSTTRTFTCSACNYDECQTCYYKIPRATRLALAKEHTDKDKGKTSTTAATSSTTTTTSATPSTTTSHPPTPVASVSSVSAETSRDGKWTCDTCTFANKATDSTCEMCSSAKPK